jgi:hypothetical protein
MLNPIKPRACLTPSKSESELTAFFKFLADRDAIQAALKEIADARAEAAPILAKADEVAALAAGLAERERLVEQREAAVTAREAEAEARWSNLRRIAAAAI